MDLLLDTPTLDGQLVRLEPLAQHHAADLAVAAEVDRGTYGYTWVPCGPEVEDYIRLQLERGRSGRFTPLAQIRLADERAVGCTAYWDPRTLPGRSEPYAVEIGFTWLGASAQRTGINVESKYLLFKHAFEQVGVARVDLKTDARNEQSRRAIEGLGASFEGVLRKWSQSWAPGEEGGLRDSAMYSIIQSEWSACKALLRARLDSLRDGPRPSAPGSSAPFPSESRETPT
jgi:N-acetyltransferase